MDEFKNIKDSNNVITISNTIHKIFNSLRVNKSKSEEKFSKELDFLKSNSKSENIKVQQLVCQALLKLAETNTLEISNIVSILVSALPNSTLNQHAVIADNIIEVLLIDLRRRSQDNYVCPFDIRPPQHPIILLLHKDVTHMMYLSNKITYICQHHDQSVSKNSVEFLRPVLLHIFCNNNIIPECASIWNTLLHQSLTDASAAKLIQEIISWTKTDSAGHALFTNGLLYDFLKVMLEKKEYFSVIELCLYFVSVTKSMIVYGFDPRKNLSLLLQILKCTHNVDRSYFNVLLILLASMLQIVSPVFVADLLEIIAFIVTTAKNDVNFLPLYLIMDGCIQWIAHPSFAATSLNDAEFLLQHIAQINKHTPLSKTRATSKHRNTTIYYSSEVTFYYFVSILFENTASTVDFTAKLNEFMGKIHLKSQEKFIKNVEFILRGLFLCNFLDKSTWCQVSELLIKISANNDSIKTSILMPFFYKLSNETDPKIRLTLLRYLASFGAKDRILKTFTVISNDIPKSLHIDLYLQIWKSEPRTYPYLQKLLIEIPKKTDEAWELDVTKAYTIKQICSIKQQHGRELVSLLSDILNRCWEEKDELAASLAVDSIAILCEHHVINAVSTWKVLNLKFRYEKRIKVVESLCSFFSLVPNLKSNTIEYETFLNEVIDRLWNYIVNSDVKEILCFAAKALVSFPPDTMQLRHIPSLYRVDIGELKRDTKTDTEQIDLAVEIPGECWIQLMQKVNYSALEDVGNLLVSHISNEIDEYRGGVYLLPEGKPEPAKLRQLPSTSILKAMVHFLIRQSSKPHRNENDIIIMQALRILAMKYSKPIPPLDWCFLHDYFHRDVQTRKYCVSIAAKQSICSGTAKRLIENYLLEFNAENVVEEDILSIFDVFPYLVKSISTNILDDFLQNTLYFVYKQSKKECFTSGCLFEKVLTLMKPAIVEPCENNGNFELLYAVLDKYLHILDINDKVFEQFIALVCSLPTTHLEKITSPTTWWEYDSTKFQKVTIIRSNIHKYNKSIANPLEWMNSLIDTVSDQISEQEFMLHELINLLYSYDNFVTINVWILHLMGRLQSIFAEKDINNKDKCVFLLDIFMASIIVLSGCGNLVDNGKTLTISLELRLQLFPPSVHHLYSQDILKDFDTKTYEFLYYLFHQTDVPDCYATAFKNALICCKNATYFQQPKTWSKFVSIRRRL